MQMRIKRWLEIVVYVPVLQMNMSTDSCFWFQWLAKEQMKRHIWFGSLRQIAVYVCVFQAHVCSLVNVQQITSSTQMAILSWNQMENHHN